MKTARTSSSIERATLIAWTDARSRPGIGTTTRSSRFGGGTTVSGRTASSRRALAYWRAMNSIIPTSSGTRMTTRYAPVLELLEHDDAQDDGRQDAARRR